MAAQYHELEAMSSSACSVTLCNILHLVLFLEQSTFLSSNYSFLTDNRAPYRNLE